jgi:hypothetical protein
MPCPYNRHAAGGDQLSELLLAKLGLITAILDEQPLITPALFALMGREQVY